MTATAAGRAQIVLVRHGETEWSRDGRHTSRTDIPLTGEGQSQARSLGARLDAWTFALVLTSPMARARETCRLAGQGERAQVTDDLKEWDYGDYEGRRTAEIRAERPGWTLWRDGAPGGETAFDVQRRADRVIARADVAGGDVAVFAHGHLLRILAARWAGLPPTAAAHLALDTATVSVLGWERDERVVRRWNVPA